MDVANDTILAVIEKSADEEIRISRTLYHGLEFLDVRIFMNDAGRRFPTKRGLTLAPELAGKLAAALREAVCKTPAAGPISAPISAHDK